MRQLDAIGRALGLRGWVIHIENEPASPGKAAEVCVVYGRKIAKVNLASDWWSYPAAERHHVLVHEMIHVVMDPMRTYLNETMPILVGEPAWHAIAQALRFHDEQATDQLATALAPFIHVAGDA
jgi:hypothetical protein